MSIPYPLVEFLFAENAYKPFPKEILLLGRQSVTITESQLREICHKYERAVEEVTIDTVTTTARNNPDKLWITDETLFRALGITTIRAIDHTNYEGADIVLDICDIINSDLEGKFELIFNGSVLDNVFNPANAMQNVGRLLAPNGRAIHIETATANIYSYSALSPSWFFDYAVWNNWADCKVYMGVTGGWDGLLNGSWAMLGFDPKAEDKPNAFTPNLGDELGVIVCIAEKSDKSTWELSPIQSHYRTEEDWAAFKDRCAQMWTSGRGLHMGRHGIGEPLASYKNAWVSCGFWGA